MITLLEAGTGASGISELITTAVAEVKGEAMVVIGAAIGLSVVFWGARVLWNRFRGMAK